MVPFVITLLKRLIWLLLIFVSINISVSTDLLSMQDENEMIIGVAEEPPFSIKNEDGSWSGLTIDLWKEISKELNLKNHFKEYDYESLLEALQNKTIDVAITALPITFSKDKIFDFSHAYFTSNLAIATNGDTAGGWQLIYDFLKNKKILIAFLIVFALLLAVGLLIWIFEHRSNREQFGGKKASGVGQGFWWAATTMTTVGYGDKFPITIAGKIIAIIWMFFSVILLSILIGIITSSLTLNKLQTLVRGPHDLPNVRVGAMIDSEAASYLTRNKIDYRSYPSEENGLKNIMDNKIDAFVGDEPVIRYLIKHNFKNQLTLLPKQFEREYFGLGLVNGCPLRERINIILLSIIHSRKWSDLTYKYLGAESDVKKWEN